MSLPRPSDRARVLRISGSGGGVVSGLRADLDPSIEVVVGEAADVASAVTVIEATGPDCRRGTS